MSFEGRCFLRASRSFADFRSRWPFSMARANVSSFLNAVEHSHGQSEPGSQGMPPRETFTHSKHIVCFEYAATVPLHFTLEQSRLPVPSTILDSNVTNTFVQQVLLVVGLARYIASYHEPIGEPSTRHKVTNGRSSTNGRSNLPPPQSYEIK